MTVKFRSDGELKKRWVHVHWKYPAIRYYHLSPQISGFLCLIMATLAFIFFASIHFHRYTKKKNDKKPSSLPFPYNKTPWERFFTFKVANAATKSDPSSGKSSAMSTVSTPPENTTAILPPIFNWRGLMSITTRLLAVDTFPGLFSWILNRVPWIVSDPVPTVRSFAPIISFLVSPVPEIIGLKVIIPKEPSWSIPFLMLFVRKLRIVIACKVLRSLLSSIVHSYYSAFWFVILHRVYTALSFDAIRLFQSNLFLLTFWLYCFHELKESVHFQWIVRESSFMK